VIYCAGSHEAGSAKPPDVTNHLKSKENLAAHSKCLCKETRHDRHKIIFSSPSDASPLEKSPSPLKKRCLEIDPDYTGGTSATSISSNTDEFIIHDKNEFERQYSEMTLDLCLKNLKQFCGVDIENIFILKLLEKYVNKNNSLENIVIVLRKIKLNESLSILGCHFGLSVSQISRIFHSTLPALASCLGQLIFRPSKISVYKNLPMAFRVNYFNVTEIIDCFEIEIEKPSNPVHQALTWSDYKKCNTIKYLISVTPDGHISYVSPGYGGRVADSTLAKHCGYLDSIPENSVILADRGFKFLEEELQQRNCSLVRPPSVGAEDVLSEKESTLTKQVAALRIVVERVIGRLREFLFLTPHSVIDIKILSTLNNSVRVACGLVNLQGKITKI
jgi:hypothetical protein